MESRLRGRGIDGGWGRRQHVAEHDAKGALRQGARPPSLRLTRCTDVVDRSVGRDPRTLRKVGKAKHAKKKKERKEGRGTKAKKPDGSRQRSTRASRWMCGFCSIGTPEEDNLPLIERVRGTAVRASPSGTGKRRRLGASTEQGNLIYALKSVRISTSEV